MAKLKWRQSPDSWKVIEARASRGLGGGLYQICDDGSNGCYVTYQKARYANSPQSTIGETEHRAEAIALAQGHNDQKLLERFDEREQFDDGGEPCPL